MSIFVAVTDPTHLMLPDGARAPHRSFLEIDGGRVHGTSAFNVRLGDAGAIALGEAVRKSPQAGSWQRFTWVAE